MIFVPLPFVVALLLAILLVRMLRQNDWAEQEKRPFLLVIAAYTLQSILIGIRWGYDVIEILPAQSVVASLIAALAWISFRNLATDGPASLLRFWPHILPSVSIVALLVFWRDPIGPILTVIFLAYGAALLWLGRQGPDALVSSRLDGALLSYRSLLITGVALIASAAADIAISLDLEQSGGLHAGAIVALGNVITLLILGTAASIASGSQSIVTTASEPPAPPVPNQEDDAIAGALENLMQSRQIYRDPDLNLGRIARKMNLPARRVSIAVNRVHGVSVSQYVNDYRIRAACETLVNTDDPVTRLMFDCGFISKSNFNREFLRVAGTNPSEFRRRSRHKPEAAGTRPTLFVSR
ncbi:MULTISPECIES: helix-turn-helix domain-containing protein [Rhizobium]|uniref:Arabinose operon regulatory protein n=1 Tax=Rhizobium favelukesii TaxID=348824 RepID=W6RXZ5_9HYPH|nr:MULTISPECIES: AraC family transcriptional regulator [Rhizobium]MCS0461109.1 AraC family transcriptional regulator [Rhizobium favelukesii]UFS83282.1 AraC family transcriptional regulator [Rhizobium sp. T136]CDM59151.1 Arabinose operon regulatory protein [Rhizobium favelukesii]